MQGMNFQSLDYSEARAYLMDDRYAFEQKMDGTRALICVEPGGEARALGRSGEPLKHSAAVQHLPKILNAIPRPRGTSYVLDGEVMIDTGLFYAFDLPRLRDGLDVVVPEMSFRARRQALEKFLAGRCGPALRIIASVWTPIEKHRLLARVEDNNGEGVIIKDRSAPYEPGVRVSHSFKCKIVRTADVVVMEVNRPDPKHGSITFGVYNDLGRLERLSSCSAIGKPEVHPGDVIEVAYLAWTPGGGLREPRMTRVREDQAPADCRLDQFREYSKGAVS